MIKLNNIVKVYNPKKANEFEALQIIVVKVRMFITGTRLMFLEIYQLQL